MLPTDGVWRLDRRLADRRAGVLGRVTGTLTVTVEPTGQRWDEEGELVWLGQRRPVHRRSYLRRRDGEWWVHFADGRPFHPFRPGVLVTHDCRADRYTGRIDLRPGRWRTLWDVTGPAKEQRIVSRFSDPR